MKKSILVKTGTLLLLVGGLSACSTARFGTDHNDVSLLISARGPVEILNDTRYPHPPTKTRIPTTLPEGVMKK